MSDRVERVSRAICRAHGENPDAVRTVVYERVVGYQQGGPPKTSPVSASVPMWKRYEGDAIAAIAEIDSD